MVACRYSSYLAAAATRIFIKNRTNRRNRAGSRTKSKMRIAAKSEKIGADKVKYGNIVNEKIQIKVKM